MVATPIPQGVLERSGVRSWAPWQPVRSLTCGRRESTTGFRSAHSHLDGRGRNENPTGRLSGLTARARLGRRPAWRSRDGRADQVQILTAALVQMKLDVMASR